MIGYLLLFSIEVILITLLVIIYPIIGAFYFIKTGDVENTPFFPHTPVEYIDNWYRSLLNKKE